MRMYDIIEKKKRNIELSEKEINFFVNGYTNGDIPDYQISALLMAIYFNGMSDNELSYLTLAMANSGDTIDLSSVNGITVDKHSTGGVGDKTTLIVALIVAALGCKVAKMSGRGLGFTGGTIDKLESIPNYSVNISTDDFFKQVNEIGLSIIAQSGNLTPADKKLYALRDVTATIDSIPLIASSVMSKKLAAGASCIVLDVKVGSGAFMKDVESAKLLAQKMVNIGYSANRKVLAVISNMDIPLGNAIGNSLEIKEAIDVLKGNGPKDLIDICTSLASYMVMLSTNKNIEECRSLVNEVIKNGNALDKFKQLVKYQNGNVDYINNPELFKQSKYQVPFYAEKSGFISNMNTELIGNCSSILGAGRNFKEDTIDFSAGIILKSKTGDFVNKGDIIAVLHSSDEEKIQSGIKVFRQSITFSDKEVKKQPLIYDVINMYLEM